MATCDASCSPTGCSGIPNSEVLLKKINIMITDNYTLLFVLVIILGVLGVSLWYFISSFKKTIKNYLDGKREVLEAGKAAPPKDKKQTASMVGGDPKNPQEDNEIYYMDPKTDNPTLVDPNEFLPKEKKAFLSSVDTAYEDYNLHKTRYITSTYNGRDNDDIINDQVMYSDYDDYDYKLQ